MNQAEAVQENLVPMDEHLKDLTPEEKQKQIEQYIREVAEEEGLSEEEVTEMVQRLADMQVMVEPKKRLTKAKINKEKNKKKSKLAKASKKRNRK